MPSTKWYQISWTHYWSSSGDDYRHHDTIVEAQSEREALDHVALDYDYEFDEEEDSPLVREVGAECEHCHGTGRAPVSAS